MKYKTLSFVLIFALVSMLYAQNTSAQAPASGSGGQTKAERPEHMIEMHKQQMAAMKADVEKMKAALAAMKANIASISDQNELARWRFQQTRKGVCVVEAQSQAHRRRRTCGACL